MASDVVWPRLRSVVLAMTASAQEPGSIAEVKASLCCFLWPEKQMSQQLQSPSDPQLYKLVLLHASHLLDLLFLQDLSKAVIEESGLSWTDMTSGIMQYLLSMIKNQKKWVKLLDLVWKPGCISS